MFVLPILTGIGAMLIPYYTWNPIFRSVSTGAILSYVLFMQLAIAILAVGCIHYWYLQTKNKTFTLKKIYTSFAIISLAVLCCCYSIGMFYGKNNLVIRQVSLPITNLPQSFTGYKIAHLSDFHLGSMYNRSTVKRMIDSVNTMKPDMIAITGDIVTLCSSELKIYLPILKQLYAKDGIYMVLGNHDYTKYPHYPNAYEKTTDSIAFNTMITDSLNWILLNDDSRLLIRNNDTIAIAGTQYIGLPSLKKIKLFGDNPYSFGDINKALHNVGNHNTILLTHNPVIWSRKIIQHYPIVDITLSGHTHAGQMGIYKKKYQHQYSEYNDKTKAGLFQHNNQYLYINSGIGTSAMHSRFLIYPEITLITLK